MAFDLALDDPERPDVLDLLKAHAAFALSESPPDTCHFFGVARLKAPDITFWGACREGLLYGVAALKALGSEEAELKSMHVAAARRGQGASQALMHGLLDAARARGYRCLWLETGTTPGFQPALRLYRRFGFVDCEPFGDYEGSDFNAFMRLDLAG